jgi:hypothetical protein
LSFSSITSISSPYQKEDIDSEPPMTNPSSYINRILRKRRKHRQLRRANKTYTLDYYIRRLPRQNTNNEFANHIYNGTANFA